MFCIESSGKKHLCFPVQTKKKESNKVYFFTKINANLKMRLFVLCSALGFSGQLGIQVGVCVLQEPGPGFRDYHERKHPVLRVWTGCCGPVDASVTCQELRGLLALFLSGVHPQTQGRQSCYRQANISQVSKNYKPKLKIKTT